MEARHLPAFVSLLPGQSLAQSELHSMPPGKQPSGDVVAARLQARLRGLPCQRFQGRLAQEGRLSEDPLHRERVARLHGRVPHVQQLEFHQHQKVSQRGTPRQSRGLVTPQTHYIALAFGGSILKARRIRGFPIRRLKTISTHFAEASNRNPLGSDQFASVMEARATGHVG